MVELLRETLSKHTNEYIKYLKDLIAIDTQHIGQGIDGGKEKAGQEYIIELMEAMGVNRIKRDSMNESYIQQAIEEHNEGNPKHNYDDRYNVYASFAGQQTDVTLMFNGHMDTMPPGPLSLWQTNPFVPQINDNKLIGLGAADMKSGLIASILAVKLLQDSKTPLPINVAISSVVDEEGGGNGSIQAALVHEPVNGVVVCEPTNNDLILAHMGFIFFRIEVVGSAHHSGSKWLGINAIEKLNVVINQLKQIEYQWLFEHKHPLLPPPNLNIGVLEGGTSGATVPGYCKMETCIHYHPHTMSFESVKADIEKAVAAAVASDEWLNQNPPKVTIFQSGGGFEMEEDTPIVNYFKEAYQLTKGYPVKVTGSPAGCDSRVWKNIHGAPTIQYGPGRLEECHSPNEFVDLEQFLDSILIYAQLILQWGKENDHE